MLPLRLLRFAVSNVVGIAYMPLISVFSSVFNCPAPGTSPAVHLYFPADLTRAAPRPALASAPDLPQATDTLPAPSSSSSRRTTTRPGPRAREYFSRPHSRVDAFFFVNNVLLSVLINLGRPPAGDRDGLAFAFTYASFVCFLDTQARPAPPRPAPNRPARS
eukprot:tig00021489_g21706.t1